MRRYFLFVSMLIWASCLQSNELTILKKVIPDFDSKKIVIVIPYYGCTSCINSAKIFLKESIEKRPEIQFIITRARDKKLIRGEFKEFYRLPNFFVDFENVILKIYDSDYPIIIRADNGQIIETEVIDLPKKEIWSQL